MVADGTSDSLVITTSYPFLLGGFVQRHQSDMPSDQLAFVLHLGYGGGVDDGDVVESLELYRHGAKARVEASQPQGVEVATEGIREFVQARDEGADTQAMQLELMEAAPL